MSVLILVADDDEPGVEKLLRRYGDGPRGLQSALQPSSPAFSSTTPWLKSAWLGPSAPLAARGSPLRFELKHPSLLWERQHLALSSCTVTYRQGQQRVGQDPFPEPSATGRTFRHAAGSTGFSQSCRAATAAFSSGCRLARRRAKPHQGAAPHDLRQHHRRDAWPGRPHPAQPAASAERAVEPADRGPQQGAGSVRERPGDRRDRADRFGKGLRRRGRHQGDAGQELRRRVPRRLHLALGERVEDPQARSSPRWRASRSAAAANWR